SVTRPRVWRTDRVLTRPDNSHTNDTLDHRALITEGSCDNLSSVTEGEAMSKPADLVQGMRWFRQMTLRLRTLFQRDRVERELEEEFQFHIEQRIELEIARGLSPEDARSAALRAMDGVQLRKEECRDMRRANYVDDLLRDLQ